MCRRDKPLKARALCVCFCGHTRCSVRVNLDRTCTFRGEKQTYSHHRVWVIRSWLKDRSIWIFWDFWEFFTLLPKSGNGDCSTCAIHWSQIRPLLHYNVNRLQLQMISENAGSVNSHRTLGHPVYVILFLSILCSLSFNRFSMSFSLEFA